MDELPPAQREVLLRRLLQRLRVECEGSQGVVLPASASSWWLSAWERSEASAGVPRAASPSQQHVAAVHLSAAQRRLAAATPQRASESTQQLLAAVLGDTSAWGGGRAARSGT